MKVQIRMAVCLAAIAIAASVWSILQISRSSHEFGPETDQVSSKALATPAVLIASSKETTAISPAPSRSSVSAPSDSDEKAILGIAADDIVRAFELIGSSSWIVEKDAMRLKALKASRLHDLSKAGTLLDAFERREDRQRALVWLGAAMLRSRGYRELFKECELIHSQEDRNFLMEDAASEAIAGADLPAAEQMWSQMPFSKNKDSILINIAAARSRTNMAEAVSWVANMPLREDRLKAVLPVITEAIGLKDLSALTSVYHLDLDERQRTSTMYAAGKVIAGDLDIGRAWIAGLDAADRGTAVAAIIDSYTRKDLAPVLSLVNELPDSRARSSAIASLTYQAATQDPTGTSRWVLQLPADVRPSGISSLVYKWYGVDSSAMAEWVMSIPPGVDRDNALVAASGSIKNSDAKTALRMAELIGDEKVRAIQLQSVNRK